MMHAQDVRLRAIVSRPWLRGDERVLIFGAGYAGGLVAEELLRRKESGCQLLGFIDDDVSKHGTQVRGSPVLGGRDILLKLAASLGKVVQVIIAMPSAPSSIARGVVDLCYRHGIRCYILPGYYDILTGYAGIYPVREVRIEDLLGREPIAIDTQAAASYLQDKTVLVTGAGGSIGSEVCRQIMPFRPRRLVLFDQNENHLYEIQLELASAYDHKVWESVIADMRNRARVMQVFQHFLPEVVFHTAAYKHVPIMEFHPSEAVLNNVEGLRNVLDAVERYSASRFLFVSSDKAVNPCNVMGITKRIGELMVKSRAQRNEATFSIVRFGNVLGSRGSVVPLFIRQIELGGPVTLTHPDMVRFFMSISEAAKLIIQVGIMMTTGRIYILDIGEPVRILDLAERLIRLAGYEPGLDIPIKFIGLRPGEKMYEELLDTSESRQPTEHPSVFCVVENASSQHPLELDTYLERLLQLASEGGEQGIVAAMQEIAPNYVPQPFTNQQ